MLRELTTVRMVVEACAAPERVRRSLTLALGDVEAAWVQLRMERDALRVRVEEAEAIALQNAKLIESAERERVRLVAEVSAVWEKRDQEFDRAQLAEQRADELAALLGERVGA